MRVLRIKITSCVPMAVVLASLVGCSTIQPAPEREKKTQTTESTHVSDMEYLAAVDLINTVVQVPRLHPANSEVLQMKRPTPGFGQNLYDVMTVAGYEIRIVDTDTVREPQVSYSQRTGTNKTTFQINIEQFKARRAYSVQNSRVKPDSSIYIFGADPDNINTNDLIFEKYHSAS